MEGAAGKTSGLETISGFTWRRSRAPVLRGLGWEADSSQVLTLYLSPTCVAAPLCSSYYSIWFQRGLTGTGSPSQSGQRGPGCCPCCNKNVLRRQKQVPSLLFQIQRNMWESTQRNSLFIYLRLKQDRNTHPGRSAGILNKT